MAKQSNSTQATGLTNRSDDYLLLQMHLNSLKKLEMEHAIISSNLQKIEGEINEADQKIVDENIQLNYLRHRLSDNKKYLEEIKSKLNDLPKLNESKERAKAAYYDALNQEKISKKNYETIFAGIYDFFVSFVSENTYYNTYKYARSVRNEAEQKYKSKIYNMLDIQGEAEGICYLEEDIKTDTENTQEVQQKIKKYNHEQSKLNQELTILKNRAKENYSDRSAVILCIQKLLNKYSDPLTFVIQKSEANPENNEESGSELNPTGPNIYR